MSGFGPGSSPSHNQSSLPSLPSHLQSDTHLTAHLASRYESLVIELPSTTLANGALPMQVSRRISNRPPFVSSVNLSQHLHVCCKRTRWRQRFQCGGGGRRSCQAQLHSLGCARGESSRCIPVSRLWASAYVCQLLIELLGERAGLGRQLSAHICSRHISRSPRLRCLRNYPTPRLYSIP